jgi:hypothetical protein
LETYILTKDGPQKIHFADTDVLEQFAMDGHLAPVELTGIDRAKNIESQAEVLRATNGVAIKRVNLPGQLLGEWANRIEQVQDAPHPVFLSESIFAVRDVVPPDGWAAVEGSSRRQRVTQVPPYPVITENGEVNLKLSLGGDSARVSLSIPKGDELMRLLEQDDSDNPKEWFAWVQDASLKGHHEQVMQELKAFQGRRLVVFGMGGSEIQTKDPDTQQRKTIQLSGAFITTTQLGFVMTWANAMKRIEEMAQGEQLVAPKPSAAAPAPKPTAPSAPTEKKPIREALLEMIGEQGATKEDVKGLLKVYTPPELVEIVEKLNNEGVVKYDSAAKKYIRLR